MPTMTVNARSLKFQNATQRPNNNPTPIHNINPPRKSVMAVIRKEPNSLIRGFIRTKYPDMKNAHIIAIKIPIRFDESPDRASNAPSVTRRITPKTAPRPEMILATPIDTLLA